MTMARFNNLARAIEFIDIFPFATISNA